MRQRFPQLIDGLQNKFDNFQKDLKETIFELHLLRTLIFTGRSNSEELWY